MEERSESCDTVVRSEQEEATDEESCDEELANDTVLKRDCIKAIQSLNPIIFAQKLNRVIKNTRACQGFCINDSVDNDDNTLLHFAIEAGFIEAVEKISEQSMVDLDARDNVYGYNALQLAAKLGLGFLASSLLLHPIRIRDGEQYFDLSLVRRSLLLIRAGTDPRNKHDQNCLHLAVESGDVDTLTRLLDAANSLQTIWITNTSRRPSVVEKAGIPGLKELQISEESTEAVSLASKRDMEGRTVMHLAVSNQNIEMIQVLLNYGVNPTRITDKYGQTALQLAKNSSNESMCEIFRKYTQKTEEEPTTNGSQLITASQLRQQRRKPMFKKNQFKSFSNTARKSLNEHHVSATMSSLNISRLSLSARSSDTRHSGQVETDGKRKSVFEKNKAKMSTHRNWPLTKLCVKVDAEEKEGIFEDEDYPDEPMSVARENPHRPPSVVSKPVGPFLRPSVIDPVPVYVQSQPPPVLKPSQVKIRVYYSFVQIPQQPMPPKPISKSSLRKASCLDPHEYYPMASERRGICLIINNMQYWHPEFTDRNGCDKDEKRLEQVFRSFGFMVKLLRNLSSEEMAAQLNHLGYNTDHSEYDCFVACIMSHGGLGKLFGVNGDAFPVHELTAPFTADHCPSLAGKPKLFFIQACRGEDYHQGFPTNSSNVHEDSSEEEEQDNPLDITASVTDSAIATDKSIDKKQSLPLAIKAAKLPVNHRLIPIYADFLLSYATVAGYRAQRDPKKGSIYVQTICKRLEKEGKVRGLLDIVTSVHREVSEIVFREFDQTTQNAGQMFQQMPEARHTLTRRVQFV
ncbi:apoptosis- cysteine peptidase [Cichlidogyrus casuarinus]|uniref:Apoptosis- cysteine peptidase n=1 Tax=Cichlidogyrus casuarinus TaxID=1844966 RepID=A0ABD2QIT6_9PLAT